MVTVTVSEAKPFYLIADSADGSPLSIRRTRAGDAWDRAEAASCEVPSHGAEPGRVSLGLPTLRLSTPTSGVTTTPIYDLHDGQRQHS